MSKRAEQAALKAYPPTYATVKRHAKRVQSELVDTHNPVRDIFQNGYERAEKEFIQLINQLCEAILFEWKDAADLARKTLTQIKAREEE